MRNIFSILLCIFAISFATVPEGLPANPKLGTFYVRCITQDEFRTVEERIITQTEYSKLEVVPAQMKTVQERVLVKEASKRMTTIAAVYETVE